MIVKLLIETAARSREYIDEVDRRKTIGFIKSKWNRDGGAQGRTQNSDLFYTAFSAMVMRALNGPIPKLRLWNYLRSFDAGESLDILHLFCLIRLRSVFPMSAKTRHALMITMQGKHVDTPTDLFLKVIMTEFLQADDRPDAHLNVNPEQDTTDIAAAVIINGCPDEAAREALWERNCEQGGFYPSKRKAEPTVEATAKALYALRILGFDLSQVRAPCLAFIESLHRDDGGYVSCARDSVTDSESTFFALFSIGCLMDG